MLPFSLFFGWTASLSCPPVFFRGLQCSRTTVSLYFIFNVTPTAPISTTTWAGPATGTALEMPVRCALAPCRPPVVAWVGRLAQGASPPRTKSAHETSVSTPRWSTASASALPLASMLVLLTAGVAYVTWDVAWVSALDSHRRTPAARGRLASRETSGPASRLRLGCLRPRHCAGTVDELAHLQTAAGIRTWAAYWLAEVAVLVPRQRVPVPQQEQEQEQAQEQEQEQAPRARVSLLAPAPAASDTMSATRCGSLHAPCGPKTYPTRASPPHAWLRHGAIAV